MTVQKLKESPSLDWKKVGDGIWVTLGKASYTIKQRNDRFMVWWNCRGVGRRISTDSWSVRGAMVAAELYHNRRGAHDTLQMAGGR